MGLPKVSTTFGDDSSVWCCLHFILGPWIRASQLPISSEKNLQEGKKKSIEIGKIIYKFNGKGALKQKRRKREGQDW